VKIFASLYLDEDMNNMVATLLRSRGIDAVTVQKSDMLGKSDQEQLAYAAANDRCILTHNRVDYEDLHLQYAQANLIHSGIIVVPQKSPYEIVNRVMILLDSMTADEIANQLLYV
jgi:predicted nuclease of predicted toxin-antitoxin system